jgi:hypothetical protein
MYAQVGLSDKSAALLEQCLINLIKSLPTTRGEWDNDYREWTRDVSWLLQTLLVLKNTHNLMPMSPSILQQWKNLRDLLPKSLLETYSLVKLTD